MFILLLILFSYSGYADAPGIEYYKAREKGFKEYLLSRDKNDNASEVDRLKIKKEREEREARLERERETFVRKTRSNAHLEKAFLAEVEAEEKQRMAQQEAYANKQKNVQEYIDKNVTPMKKQEYDIQDLPSNAQRP